ncbi:MAG: M20/M25/M40 family metallo-hydrolase [Acidobacteriota bacterium]|jgi:acetylornithine deacetylase/succinyl-diaminopimelate desuccinylase-like protein|nr:M20/M25/M40 family metallo-hydrolase [Bryobacteraceae bacterium CoA2 C42]MCA2965178.1 M20/M25/M40 family metallo-hydrolase [Acidobacteriaceae bacterium]
MVPLLAPGVASVSALAGARGVKEALLLLSKDKQWVNEKHLALCRIPSPTFFEQKRAEWMQQQFRALGCESTIDAAGNVITFLSPNPAGPYVAVTAHLDTVLAPRTPEEVFTQPDGSFHGPGVSDNGAGLAALLALVRVFKMAPELAGVSAAPVFIANVGEEGEGNLSGMRHLCRQSALAPKIRSYLILDGPSTDHVTCQALASRRFEISFSGPGGHSWSDYGVGNPVHALSRVITLFAENQPEPVPGVRSSFNFGVIDGGVSVNSIPGTARAKLDIRSESAAQLEHLGELLKSCVTKATEMENAQATAARVTAKLRETGARPGGGLPTDAPLLRYLAAVDHWLGIRSRIDCSSTDANIPLSMNLPAVSIGAGGTGGGAHTPAEWFRPEGRDTGLKRILLTLALLLAE